MNTRLLEITDISKAYSGVPVLRNVGLQLDGGRILGLVGENGAGKSTLMNILGGVVPADAGNMVLNGTAYAPHSPRDAERAGIAFIHQELNLFPNLSVTENLFLTRFPQYRGWINGRELNRRAAAVLDRVGLHVNGRTPVRDLSLGQRQMVEIAKALTIRAKLIILDEPTTSLTVRERDALFRLLQELKNDRLGMIYISHALDDVRQQCDDLVVLRDGTVVGVRKSSDYSLDQIVSLMVGRQITQQFPIRSSQPQSEIVLGVNHVCRNNVVRDISFVLHRGEILGISGLMGSGRTELARLLFGLDRVTSGQIVLEGSPIERLTPGERSTQGMAFVTESRHDDGLLLTGSVWENIGLVGARLFTSGPTKWIRRGDLSRAVARIRDSVALPASIGNRQSVNTLSGGNQQKVVLGKWLLNAPRVLILDEPTRGIDVGARYEIYQLIDRLAAQGTSVLLISSELEELVGMCDRILVMAGGTVTDNIPRDAFDRERILRAALPASQRHGVVTC